MTRREFASLAAAIAAAAPTAPPLAIPVHVVIDSKANLSPRQIDRFWYLLWPEAWRDLARGGIRLQNTSAPGVVERPPFREPVISGLDAASLNVVVTSRIPSDWDNGRALAGVSLRYRGYHVCMIAMAEARGNQVPFLSVNTVLHEILHALLHDIFELRPGGVHGQAREARIDWYATSLWLFHGAPGLRESARTYLARLRADAYPRK